GRDGRPGRGGEAGRDRAIRAEGGQIGLDLRGKNGTDGQDGTDATSARCQIFHTEPEEDLEAADGGDGGNGGHGGAGGNGGMLTVYYQDVDKLKTVDVDATGGIGGRGGRGGRGTLGCACHQHEWTITDCEDDGSCETEEYTCKDGRNGQQGSDGRDGETGEVGRARLVKQLDELLPENVEETRAIATFPSTPIELSRNLWETRTGAQALFAAGSVISDTYQQYTGRAEQQFQLIWEAERPASELSGNLNLAINEQGELQVNPVEDLWIDSTLSTEGDLTTYRVNGAVVASEATRLTLGRNSGRGEQFTLNVIDLAAASDLVETRFYLRYRTNDSNRRPVYVNRYEDEIPSNLITQEYNRFTIPIGQLPIRDRYLRDGTEVSMELVITRSYVGNSAEQTLDWTGQL
ncbi:MAG: collagen-like protein, partial [Cyanobacteria bacterium J06588_5]